MTNGVVILVESAPGAKPQALPVPGYVTAEDPGHKRSLCPQEGGWGLEGPGCLCLTEGAPLAPMLFLFSALTTSKVCVGAHKEMPPVLPPPPVVLPPSQPTGPPHTHICMKMGQLWSHFRYIDVFSRFYGFVERWRSILSRAAQTFSDWVDSHEPACQCAEGETNTSSFKMGDEKINAQKSF